MALLVCSTIASVVHIGNKTENDFGRRWKFEHVLWSDVEHQSYVYSVPCQFMYIEILSYAFIYKLKTINT